MIVTTQQPAVPSLYCYFSRSLWEKMLTVPSQNLEEIRVRLQKPVVLHYTKNTAFLSQRGGITSCETQAYTAQKSDIEGCMEKLCHGSIYAYQNEIKNGYLTTPEGDRVGLSGQAVMEGDLMINLKEISGLNFRFSHEILGAADALMPYIYAKGGINSVLLLSPPQCGKTTMLRDAARQLAGTYKTVIIDERCEIAGMVHGISHYQLGTHSEVISGCPKDRGMQMALRSLSPEVMITDELGRQEDVQAVRQAMNCGVAILASMHAGSLSECEQKYGMEDLWKLFDVIVLLTVENGKRRIKAVQEHVV